MCDYFRDIISLRKKFQINLHYNSCNILSFSSNYFLYVMFYAYLEYIYSYLILLKFICNCINVCSFLRNVRNDLTSNIWYLKRSEFQHDQRWFCNEKREIIIPLHWLCILFWFWVDTREIMDCNRNIMYLN